MPLLLLLGALGPTACASETEDAATQGAAATGQSLDAFDVVHGTIAKGARAVALFEAIRKEGGTTSKPNVAFAGLRHDALGLRKAIEPERPWYGIECTKASTTAASTCILHAIAFMEAQDSPGELILTGNVAQAVMGKLPLLAGPSTGARRAGVAPTLTCRQPAGRPKLTSCAIPVEGLDGFNIKEAIKPDGTFTNADATAHVDALFD